MTLLAYVLYLAALTGLAWLVALWMARVYAGALPATLLAVEGAVLRVCGVRAGRGPGQVGNVARIRRASSAQRAVRRRSAVTIARTCSTAASKSWFTTR